MDNANPRLRTDPSKDVPGMTIILTLFAIAAILAVVALIMQGFLMGYLFSTKQELERIKKTLDDFPEIRIPQNLMQQNTAQKKTEETIPRAPVRTAVLTYPKPSDVRAKRAEETLQKYFDDVPNQHNKSGRIVA